MEDQEEAAAGTGVTYSLGKVTFCSLLPLQPHSSKVPSVDGRGISSHTFPFVHTNKLEQMQHPFLRAETLMGIRPHSFF